MSTFEIVIARERPIYGASREYKEEQHQILDTRDSHNMHEACVQIAGLCYTGDCFTRTVPSVLLRSGSFLLSGVYHSTKMTLQVGPEQP